ncbi:MAG: Fe-S cluster assembly protein SufD [Lentisphaeria bacterium]|jgi:Fe-S cluster assembly protein SufD
MVNFIEQAVGRRSNNSPDWLQDFQQQQLQRWAVHALPDRKTEDWKYTNLKPLADGRFFSSRPVNFDAPSALLQSMAVNGKENNGKEGSGKNSIDLVFVNGEFSSTFSSCDDLPEGLTLTRFADADKPAQDIVREHLGTIANVDKHMFVTLNNCQFEDGVLLRIARNIAVDPLVRIVHLSTRQDAPFSVAQRLLVVMEEGSSATVMEQFVSDDAQQNCFAHGVTELSLGENSRLHHYRFHQEQEHALHIGGVHANLGRSSVLNSFHFALGGTVKRIDVVINHRGEGAHCDLNGIYLPRNSQHVDYHTCIEHAVPNCTTSEVFRGIIGDSAKAVFNGRIHIHRQAQKTNAQLSNKNLLTSNKAEVDTKPELEIYADDVQCAHGATVAQLDQNSLHYFKTRGISKEEALVMLSFGFINELVNQIKHPDIADYLRPFIARFFAQDDELLRHIV